MKDLLWFFRGLECPLPPPGFSCLGCASILVGTPLGSGIGPVPSHVPPSPLWCGLMSRPSISPSPPPWPFPELQGCVWPQRPSLDLLGAAGTCQEAEGPARLPTPAFTSCLPSPLPAQDSSFSTFFLAITQNCLTSGNGTGHSQLKEALVKKSLAFENDFKVPKSHPVQFPYLHKRIRKGFQPRRIRRTWPSWPFICRDGKPNTSYHNFSFLLCPYPHNGKVKHSWGTSESDLLPSS